MTEKFELILNLQGFECNGFPNCKVIFNDKVLLNCQIIDSQVYKFNITLESSNILTIEQYGKNFGENNLWDTILENGKIVKDKFILIKSIKINDIDIKPWWHKGHLDNEYIFENQNEIGLYKNVKYKLVFNSPFYNWLIEQNQEGYKEVGPSWKKSSLNSFSDGYSITQEKFDSLLNEIKNLTNEL